MSNFTNVFDMKYIFRLFICLSTVNLLLLLPLPPQLNVNVVNAHTILVVCGFKIQLYCFTSQIKRLVYKSRFRITLRFSASIITSKTEHNPENTCVNGMWQLSFTNRIVFKQLTRQCLCDGVLNKMIHSFFIP